MSYFFAIVAPYACAVVFLTGLVYRVLLWARSSVPFRIPTTSGQQISLPWIKSGILESPHTKRGVVARMALEILLFRSLFRNTKVNLHEGPRLIYGEEKFLWLGALAFHWSMLIIILRHLRFVLEPVPGFVLGLQSLDGIFQVGTPVFFLTDAVFMVSLAYLLLRRLSNPQVRYISLLTDYLALGLLLGLAVTGIWMRYVAKEDVFAIKEFAMGLATFSPHVPENVGLPFYLHLFFLSALLAYFPYSKLMHMAGSFLSPTRNLANNNRMKRHVNSWDYPVKVHTYAEWEDEFRNKIKAAGLPLERQ
jgi:nitrate reductase gamma subunit